ncbi:hypothetical protein BJV77DRAFT_1047108, partial [Russula vinacea]
MDSSGLSNLVFLLFAYYWARAASRVPQQHSYSSHPMAYPNGTRRSHQRNYHEKMQHRRKRHSRIQNSKMALFTDPW